RKTFEVPIVDHESRGLPMTVQVALFGPSPIGMAHPSSAVLTIINDDAPATRDPNNPLALRVAPSGTNPLDGARFFVDHESTVAKLSAQYPALGVIANQPGASRYGAFSHPNAGIAVQRYLERAQVQEPGSIPM